MSKDTSFGNTVFSEIAVGSLFKYNGELFLRFIDTQNTNAISMETLSMTHIEDDREVVYVENAASAAEENI